MRDYFCDKDAQATASDVCWEIELNWTGGNGRHVDPRLEVGLASWGGIPEEEMWRARRRSGRVLVSLYDSWTLLAWSEWLSSASDLEGLTILHVDDHRDLGSPRLFKAAEEWVDPFTGNSFDLLDPPSVESAIASGAVGMGSFLTPLLHLFPGAKVRQLTQPPKVKRTCDFDYRPMLIADNLIDPQRYRPGLELSPEIRKATPKYRIANDLEDWLDALPSGPILLHVDMDYFSNRYDGDGDWERREEILDPPLEVVISRIEAVGEALRKAELFPRIVSAAIAYSPGFFPAEYWHAADGAMTEALKELYAG